jgi:hypothetical protein
MNQSRILRLAVFTATLLLLLAIVRIALFPPAHKYEISTYDSIPLDFWLMVAGALFLAEVSLLGYALTARSSSLSKVAIFIVVFSNCILMSVPLFQGYFSLGRGDVLTHYGSIEYTTEHARYPGELSYPADIQMAVSLHIVGSISTGEVAILWPTIMAAFYLLSLFVFIKEELTERKALMVLAFAGSLPFGVGQILILAPSVQGFLLLPFSLYLIFKSMTRARPPAFAICALIVILATILYHPLESLILILILAVARPIDEWTRRTSRRLLRTTSLDREPHAGNGLLSVRRILYILVGALFFQWYFSFNATASAMKVFVAGIFFGPPSAPIDLYSGYLSMAHPSLQYVLAVLFLTYGEFILLFLAAIVSVPFLRDLMRRQTLPKGLTAYVRFFERGVLIFAALTIAGFVWELLVGTRYSKDFIFFSTCLIGVAVASIGAGSRGWKSGFRVAAAIGLILTISFLSVFQCYYSPLTVDPSQQVTEMEFTGAEWFLKYNESTQNVADLGLNLERFHNAILMTDFDANRKTTVPWHFGYDANTAYGKSYVHETYLTLTTLGKEWYPIGRPDFKDIWRWTPDDFRMLENDASVTRLFDNGGFQALDITPGI